MIIFFDYVYYKVAKFYNKHESAGEGTGVLVLSLMYFLNALSIFCIFCIFIHKNIYFNRWLIIPFLAALVILNGIRYNRLNYDILKERWKDEDANTQLKKGGMVLAYIILSTIICIALVIYIGSKEWH